MDKFRETAISLKASEDPLNSYNCWAEFKMS